MLRFSAVVPGQDPPAGGRLSSLRRLGVVGFLYPFLFSGLEYTLSFLAQQRLSSAACSRGRCYFLNCLTMATIQGACPWRIHPGRKVSAMKQALLLLVPAFLLIGWDHSLPMLGLGCCSTPLSLLLWCPACPPRSLAKARQGRRARSWAHCVA
ncbi:Major facilitator super domain-containing protein 10 [Saguinus oedipus]|uniref:Major facilitator super domain-containing protein 10 n=1 Tax=Saguinus oedipus TaxID=9490 RepID=A0ABQ9W3R3_SAGOE|nr:Major facilitator super domain-containing protein 10 [Saguinus oedipus]